MLEQKKIEGAMILNGWFVPEKGRKSFVRMLNLIDEAKNLGYENPVLYVDGIFLECDTKDFMTKRKPITAKQLTYKIKKLKHETD